MLSLPMHGSPESGFICAQDFLTPDCSAQHSYRDIPEGNGGSVFVIVDRGITCGASANLRAAIYNAATVAMQQGAGSHILVTEYIGTGAFDVFHVYGR